MPVTPLVSIIVPVKNGAPWLRKLFESYNRQTIKDIEFIIIDSGSTDNSVAICKDYNAAVRQIAPAEFNHGLTRQFGVDCSSGEYVLLTVQDAIPASENFVETLLNSLIDNKAAAACGLQVVPALPQTNPLHWFRPVSAPVIKCIQFPDTASFDKLSSSQKREMCSWDDVCALYKKEVFKSIPFRTVSFGEDMAWCKEALKAGCKICYNPNARVYHYHLSEDEYLYKRTLTELYHFYTLFGYVPENKSLFMNFLRANYLLLKERRVPLVKKVYWLHQEMKYQLTVRRAINDFLKYLAKGNEALKSFHEKVCGIAPQAPAMKAL